MEATKPKIVYPCRAEVAYVGKLSQHFTKGKNYLVEIYKKNKDSAFYICITGKKETQRAYISEKMLLKEFEITKIIVNEKPVFVLTILKNGNISHQASKGASSAVIISALETIKTKYVLEQLAPPS